MINKKRDAPINEKESLVSPPKFIGNKLIYNALLGFYLLIELVLPIVAAVYLQFNPPDSFKNRTPFMGIQRWLFCFAALPAYAVYAWLVITAHFPKTWREIIMLFVPVGWVIVSSTFLWSEGSFWELLIFESIPFYVALNMLLGIGLIWLVCVKEKIDYRKLTDIAALGLLSALLAILFWPGVSVAWMAWELCGDVNASGLEAWLSYGDYLLSITLALVFSFPIVKSLYQKGAL